MPSRADGQWVCQSRGLVKESWEVQCKKVSLIRRPLSLFLPALNAPAPLLHAPVLPNSQSAVHAHAWWMPQVNAFEVEGRLTLTLTLTLTLNPTPNLTLTLTQSLTHRWMRLRRRAGARWWWTPWGGRTWKWTSRRIMWQRWAGQPSKCPCRAALWEGVLTDQGIWRVGGQLLLCPSAL